MIPVTMLQCHFFRGLVYWAEGDLENARVSMKNAALVDMTASEKENRGDWMTVDMVDYGLASLMKDSNAEDIGRILCQKYQLDPGKTKIIREITDPWVMVVAVGMGPQKTYSDDIQKQGLSYTERPSAIKSVKVEIDQTEPFLVENADDVYVQAATRGTRNMDEVLKNKAKTKDEQITAGNVVAGVGGAVGGILGLGISGIGELVKGGAQKIDTTADIRQVAILPSKIYVWYGNKPAPGTKVCVRLSNDHDVVAKSEWVVPASKGPMITLSRFPY